VKDIEPPHDFGAFAIPAAEVARRTSDTDARGRDVSHRDDGLHGFSTPAKPNRPELAITISSLKSLRCYLLRAPTEVYLVQSVFPRDSLQKIRGKKRTL
jgi:hypothetical protein